MRDKKQSECKRGSKKGDCERPTRQVDTVPRGRSRLQALWIEKERRDRRGDGLIKKS